MRDPFRKLVLNNYLMNNPRSKLRGILKQHELMI